MNACFLGLYESLREELGDNLAEGFVGALSNETDGSIEKCKRLYFEIGAAWAPVLKGWAKWVRDEASYRPYLFMRDAKPLSAIDVSCEWPQVWLNRILCGVDDEISGDTNVVTNPLLERYIEEQGLDSPFTMVDTGCWGTLVKKLSCDLGLTMQPLFFFSHNPSIPGYLNTFSWIPGNVQETLNDSLECCFPNVFGRPSRFTVRDGMVVPVVEALLGLSAELGAQALSGIHSELYDESCAEKALEKLVSLHIEAQEGRFTGILPRNTPTWSEGDRFLASW